MSLSRLSRPFPSPRTMRPRVALALAALLAVAGTSQAALVTVRVNVQNLAPANGIAFAPLHVGFGQIGRAHV